MMKKYLVLTFFSLPLIAMEYCQDVNVSVGYDRKIVPMSEVLRFKALHERLVQSGHKVLHDGTWLYGTDDNVFPQNEKEAMWVINDLIETWRLNKRCNISCSNYPDVDGKKRDKIPASALWNIVRCTYRWRESDPLSIGIHVLKDAVSLDKCVYPSLPSGNEWCNDNESAIWLCDNNADSTFFAQVHKDGSVIWHNHVYKHNRCKTACDIDYFHKGLVVGSFAERYLLQDQEPACTKNDYELFCEKKRIKDIAIHSSNKKLVLTYADDTQLTLVRNTLYSMTAIAYGQAIELAPEWKAIRIPNGQ